MGTHDGHRDRMRKRFENSGGSGFEKHELLEMLLYSAYPRKDTNEYAHTALNAFGGSLTRLIFSDPKRIMDMGGLSENASVLLGVVGEICRRIDIEKWDSRVCLKETGYAGEFAKSYLNNLSTEKLYVVCLDNSLSVINCVEAANGSVGSVSLTMRSLVEIAIQNHAAKIMLMHNHPSGIAKPSYDDLEFTAKCIKAFEPIEIDIIDHIIVAGGKYFSMNDNNILPNKGGN